MNTTTLAPPRSGNKTGQDPREEAAWRAFCEAAAQAQASKQIADGKAAGRLWAQWLKLFEGRTP